MTSRRAFLALGGAAVAGAALTGCSTSTSGSGSSGSGGGGSGGAASTGTGGGGKPLSVYVSQQSSFPQEQKAWFARIQKAFQDKTGRGVQYETYTSATEEQQRIQTSVVSGTGPDVYEIGTTFTPTAFATKSFVQFDDAKWSAVGGKDRFTPATLAMSGPSPDQQIAVPFTSIPFVLAYNTAMFEKAGIAEPPKTWDELVADAKKLTTGGVYGLGMSYKDGFDPWKFVWMFANQYGNPLVADAKVTLDDPRVLRAFQAYFGFLTKDRIAPPQSVNWTGADNTAAFAAGKVAMIVMTNSQVLPTLAKSSLKSSFALAPIPTVPPGETALPAGGVPATTIVSGQNLVVASYSKDQALALEYVALVTSDAEQQHFSEVFGVLPTNAKAAAAIAGGNKNFAPVLAAGRTARPTPFTGAWSQVQLGLTNIVVQSLPALSSGSVADSAVTGQLKSLQETAQTAVTKAAKQ